MWLCQVEICRNGNKIYLDSVLLWNSPESRPSRDLVPVPTLVVMVTSLLPTSHVFVLPPANRNSPTGDLETHLWWAQPSDCRAQSLHRWLISCNSVGGTACFPSLYSIFNTPPSRQHTHLSIRIRDELNLISIDSSTTGHTSQSSLVQSWTHITEQKGTSLVWAMCLLLGRASKKSQCPPFEASWHDTQFCSEDCDYVARTWSKALLTDSMPSRHLLLDSSRLRQRLI